MHTSLWDSCCPGSDLRHGWNELDHSGRKRKERKNREWHDFGYSPERRGTGA